MPTAHLPTPANLPNLNAKSAGAPSLRERLAESEIERERDRDGEGERGEYRRGGWIEQERERDENRERAKGNRNGRPRG
ncbi:hypothetical protein V1477_016322 [Vespula maculifrons]|uniref:Uncharacterized protein n=2 Tax=Vespula TaxID=7451 RepID=A0A834N6R5_VESVU|nr:hypothetical protein HZH66_006807 [Vespula vulgaris]